MTDHEEPMTEAGRYFLKLLPGFRVDHIADGKLALMHVLAIESEARTTAPAGLDVDRLAKAFRRTAPATGFGGNKDDAARLVAAEYARLAEDK